MVTQFESLLRDGLTHQAGRILECEVHLEALRLDWATQSVVFRGVSLMNPEGYTDREALRVETVTIRPQLLTLFARTPILERVRLDGVSAHLQYRTGAGTNLGALRDNARGWAEQQVAGEVAVWGRPVVVQEIAVAPVSMKVESLAPPTPAVPLELPAFTVTEPEERGAITAARGMQLALRGLLRQAGQVESVVGALRALLTSDQRPEPTTNP
jgi:hypothetical protein